ncbi:organic hydroperoxide resistance protein [Mucilaginibacter sp. Bleaf8]|uniref:organic hydroperoxide resistance protein n=1 Tax=Mucilaginibacter sp. Bleaf8 TaxID=2834430 RepID=UPI001BCC4B84|nr:organic hydroperoxide resistance protein [Mucilaginibacter sp. Bleaf8]MBS7565584.1 organic hydroperoxide resistance protein [Mucilaginibacter sp. Bleaf8]
MESLYTAKATATGGRNGQVKSADGALDIETRIPKEMGGPGGTYLNPEILFAGGYAACFDSALNLIIRMEKVQTGTTAVTAEVSIMKQDNGGFNLAVKLDVEIPGVDREAALELVKKAHAVCPYSNATRGNIEVALSVK